MLGAPVIMKITTEKLSLPFDHVAAHEFLTKNDPHLADVITRTRRIPIQARRMRQRLRIAPRSHRSPEHFRQSRRKNLLAHSGPGRERRLPHAGRNSEDAHPRPAQSWPVQSESAGDERPRAKNHRRHRPHARRSAKNERRRTRRAPDFRARHRRLDRRNVFDFPPRPPRRPAHSRPGRAKRVAITYRKRKMPKPKDLLKFGERWRPYRTIASWACGAPSTWPAKTPAKSPTRPQEEAPHFEHATKIRQQKRTRPAANLAEANR